MNLKKKSKCLVPKIHPKGKKTVNVLSDNKEGKGYVLYFGIKVLYRFLLLLLGCNSYFKLILIVNCSRFYFALTIVLKL